MTKPGPRATTPAPRTILSAVRAFARRHGIFRPGPLVLAVSGGTDSTALALIAAELRDEFGLVLHVAHFDHRARPRASAADAQFVADLADHIGAPIRVGRADRAPKNEEQARDARYAFLRRVANEIGATAIATGHTLDDQAETVLLHLTRGSGVTGASGMRPLRDGIARPLLAIGRAQTLAICRAAKIKPREDASNRSLKFARNRVRLKVLPELERINPQIRSALARFADAAAEAGSRGATAQIDGGYSATIGDLPTDAASRGQALANALRQVSGHREISARHRQALLDLTATSAGTRMLDLPGATAIREYDQLRIEPRGEAASTTARAASPRTQGVTPLRRGAATDWHGWRITLDMAPDGLPFTARVDADAASRLVIRARRPGDRVAGRGKVQDLFVNQKVPARLRDTWPLVTLDEKVIWIPGLTPALHHGDIALAAGPTPTKGEDALMKSSQDVRVTSMSEARQPVGGKRGRR